MKNKERIEELEKLLTEKNYWDVVYEYIKDDSFSHAQHFANIKFFQYAKELEDLKDNKTQD